MSKVTLAYPVEKLQGKVNKEDDAYFNARNGRCYMNRIRNPYDGPDTADQQAVKEKFKEAVAETLAILSDVTSDTYKEYLAAYKANPGKYATLRGYIFAQVYNA